MILFLVLSIILDAKKPTVAAVEGLALGGGLEVAMVSVLYLVEQILIG